MYICRHLVLRGWAITIHLKTLAWVSDMMFETIATPKKIK